MVSLKTSISLSPVTTSTATPIDTVNNPLPATATVDLIVSHGTHMRQSDVTRSGPGTNLDEAILLETDDDDVEGTPIATAELLTDCTEEVLAGLNEFDEL